MRSPILIIGLCVVLGVRDVGGWLHIKKRREAYRFLPQVSGLRIAHTHKVDNTASPRHDVYATH